MNDLRTAAQQALEAMEAMQSYAAAERKGLRICDESITVLKAALAEHFCDTHCTWADHAPGCVMEERNFCPRCGKRANGIHTCTPPAPLTDEIIADLWHQNGGFHHHFARAIERWLRGHA